MASRRGRLHNNSEIGDFARGSAAVIARIDSGTPQAIEQSKRLLRHGVPPPGDVSIRPYDQQVFQRTQRCPASIDIEDLKRNARLRGRADQKRNINRRVEANQGVSGAKSVPIL